MPPFGPEASVRWHGAAHLVGGHRTSAVRGGVAAAGSPTMGPRRGLHGEHGGGSGVAPGKVAKGGAHLGRPPMVRWWEGATATVLDDGDRAPMAEND
jgi:hypothetical protein